MTTMLGYVLKPGLGSLRFGGDRYSLEIQSEMQDCPFGLSIGRAHPVFHKALEPISSGYQHVQKTG